MTVIPFTYRRRARPGWSRSSVVPIAVSGHLVSPSGRSGEFSGFYRLERCVWTFDHRTVAGVVTGELRDADGGVIGLGARRTRMSAEVVGDTEAAFVVRFGPLEVNLLGFLVTVEERTVDLAGTSYEYAVRATLRRSRGPTAGAASGRDAPRDSGAQPIPPADGVASDQHLWYCSCRQLRCR